MRTTVIMIPSGLAVVTATLLLVCLSHALNSADPHHRQRQRQSTARAPLSAVVSADRFTSRRASLEPAEVWNAKPDSPISEKSRRTILKAVFGCCCTALIEFGKVPSAIAESPPTVNKKPYAPIEYLLPAARVRIYIDQAVELAQAIVDNSQKRNDDPAREEQLIAKLRALLLEPRRSFMTKQESSAANNYLEQETWTEWSKARRQQNLQQQLTSATVVDPLTALNESFEQWGEQRQFQRLRKQQLALERTNTMRAAFNAYTNNLVFGETYLLTADSQDKSRLIRSYNQLPDVTSVIRSDLDLRDLHRNQVLTAMDDAKAELELQSSSDNSFDGSELISLLKEAQSACSAWFGFVPEADAQEAIQRVLSEEDK